jgi:hypothetical protein
MRSRLASWVFASAGAAALTVGFVSPGWSQDYWSLNCSRLWYERNSIFKEAGYCFHTQRGIRAFGNAGCSYDDERDVPLSDHARNVINMIRQAENEKGCPQ